jgi:hypothetical protein
VVAATARRSAARNMARSVNRARPTVRWRLWTTTASYGSITEATELIAAGMAPLDARTIDDLLAHLRQPRQDRFPTPD